jgi:hypothetical protein
MNQNDKDEGYSPVYNQWNVAGSGQRRLYEKRVQILTLRADRWSASYRFRFLNL